MQEQSHLNVVSIDIDVLVCIVENRSRSRVSRVACHVVCHHQDDLQITLFQISEHI